MVPEHSHRYARKWSLERAPFSAVWGMKEAPRASIRVHVTPLNQAGHLKCVHNNCARFEETQPKRVRGDDYTKEVSSIQNMLEK
jgi:hypothetical protein